MSITSVLLVLSVFTSLFTPSLSTTSIELTGNSYDNVYIAFNSEVQESDCEEIVKNLEVMLQESSQLLYKMTGYRVNFGEEMTVVLPKNFSCGSLAPEVIAQPGWDYEQAPIKLGQTHDLFGDTIWTQQPGQCGEMGDFIYLTQNAVKNSTTTEKIHKFVSEWAKFRWGIMEEVGHVGDPIYPPTYSLNSMNEFIPTVCSDIPLKTDNQTNCSDHESCAVEINPDQNKAVKSSLISLPEFENVEEMCSDSTHNAFAPTKQNILCNQKSAFDIFQRSPEGSNQPSVNITAPTLKLKTAIKASIVSSVVIAVEATKPDENLPSYSKQFLSDAICQTVMALFQDGIHYTVMTFDEEPNLLQDFILLNETRSESICEELEEALIAADSDERSIEKALAAATEILPEDSMIILVSDGLTSPSDNLNKCLEAAKTNRVFPIVFPKLPDIEIDEDWYNQLAEKTGTVSASIVVTPETSDNNLYSEARYDLAIEFQKVLNNLQTDQFMMDYSATCNTQISKSCSESLIVKSNTERHHISVYSISIVKVEIERQFASKCTKVDYKSSETPSVTFVCKNLEVNDEITVTTESVEKNEEVFLDLESIHENPPEISTYVTLRSTKSLHDLQFGEDFAPILYGEMFYKGRRLFGTSMNVAVEIKNSGTRYFELYDKGAGVDVTGNDGIYSGYLSGLPKSNDSTQSIDLKMSVGYTSEINGPIYVLPQGTKINTVANECCGSMLTLPGNMEEVSDFELNSTFTGIITVPQTSNLPPGQITDLKVSLNSNKLQFSFTATGSDLDYGKVKRYNIQGTWSEEEVKILQWNSDVKNAGYSQVIRIDTTEFPEDVVISYSVVGVDEEDLQGKSSNKVLFSTDSSLLVADPLTAGAIAGIIIGVFLLLLLIILLIYCCCSREDHKHKKYASFLSCKCCSSEEGNDNNLYSSTMNNATKKEQATNSNNNGGIRDVTDLYTEPKRNRDSLQQSPIPTISRTNYGFFEDDGSLNNSFPSGDRNSEVSFNSPQPTPRSTLPINRLGIPVQEKPSGRSSVNSFFVPASSVNNSAGIDNPYQNDKNSKLDTPV